LNLGQLKPTFEIESPIEVFLYLYTFDGTRKILNFVWTGRSQEKFWWKSERVLTCKSFFRFE